MKTNKVLFVDDEINILNSIKRSVIYENYEFIVATNGKKAIDIIKNDDISVIVADMKMPEMNGFDLLKKVKEISPDTIRIVLSGYNQLPQILATVNSIGVFKYIAKPWDNEAEFLPAIQEAIEYYNMKLENKKIKQQLQERNDIYNQVLKIKENLINNIEKDVISIKNITKKVLQIQDIFFTKIKSNSGYIETSEHYLKLINNMYSRFLDTFPTNINKFSIKSLVESFQSQIISAVTIDVDNLYLNHQGNYSVILLTITELVNYILKKEEIKITSVQFRNYPNLTVTLNCENLDLIEYYNNDIGFKLIIKFLTEIIKTSGGNIILCKNNKNEIIVETNTII